MYSHTFTFTDSKVVKWSGFEALVSANISGNSIERFIRDKIDISMILSNGTPVRGRYYHHNLANVY